MLKDKARTYRRFLYSSVICAIAIICSVFLAVTVKASTTVNLTGTTLDEFITACYDKTESDGDHPGRANVSATGNTITIETIGYEESDNRCSTTTTNTLTVTFKKDTTFTYTVTGDALDSATSGTYGALTAGQEYTVLSGEIITFVLSAANAKSKTAQIVWSMAEAVVEKPDDGASYVLKGGDGTVYFYLDEALAAAQNSSSSKTVIVASDGVVYHSNYKSFDDKTQYSHDQDYTIPSGVTLLIPFDAANTLCTTAPQTSAPTSYTAPTIYRTLTMASGAHIVVDGAISVSGSQSSNGNFLGAPIGALGRIHMETESTITLNSGANLYAWGYVSGTGSVLAKNGSKVYESFQINDWRGGDITNQLVDNTPRVFPVSQFYIQNVEVPLTYEVGAKGICFMSVDVTLAGTQKTSFTFIGDDGIFRIQSGTVTKDYDESTDYIELTVNDTVENGETVPGSVVFADMKISIQISVLGSVTLATANYVFPIPNHFRMIVSDNCSLQVNEDCALYPGAELIVEENASVTVASGVSAYVYDLDDWVTKQTYTFSSGTNPYSAGGGFLYQGRQFAPALYTTSRGTASTRTLKDAMLQVDGVLDMSQAYLYTTSGGANIFSTKNGTIKLQAGSATATYQVAQGGKDGYKEWTKIDVPVTPAKLLNGNGTYLSTGTDTYYYEDGVWKCTNHAYETTVKDPTCTEQGSTTKVCVVCKDTKTEYTNATGHTPGAAATCTTAQTCTVCGAELAAALGHKDVNKDHTCDNGCGVYQGTHADSATDDNHVCDYGCGAVLEDHTPGAEATCTTAQTCTVCGAELNAALGHNYGDLIPPQQEVHSPTELKPGVAAHYQCSECNAYFDADQNATTLDALTGTKPAHTFGDWQHNEEKHWKVCSCGLKSGEGSHNDGENADSNCDVCGRQLHSCSGTLANGKAATCTVDGWKNYVTCSCGKYYADEACTVEITDLAVWKSGAGKIDALTHSFTNYVSNGDAKCGVDGTKTAKCDRCDETKTVADEGSALSHSFTKYESNNDATFVADGTKTAKCDHGCGTTDTVTDEGSKLIAVAQIGDKKYQTLADALAAGGEVTLLANIETDAAFVINKTVVLNLNGFGVKTTMNDTAGDGVFHVVAGGDLTINGEGVINGVGGNNCCIAIWADGGKVTINGGTYTNVDAGEDNQYDLIYVKNGGEVIINGGTFIAHTPAWTLNCHDASYLAGNATITVNGGKFYNFNPYNNAAEGAGTNFVVTGSHAMDTDNDGYYTIEKHSYNAVVTAPTFDEKGFTKHTCACGHSYVNSYTDALIAVAQIGEQKYQTLADAIAAAKGGDTIVLLGDFSGAGAVIDKSITIDFNKKTYTFTEGVGSTGTPSNGFQILQGNTVTLKNGTLKVADEAADKFYILIQNYANLTVTDMTLDGTNLDKWSATDRDSYVLSNNCGTVIVNGNTTIKANDEGELAYAIDACKYRDYPAPTVTIETTGTISGTIEITGGTMIVNGGTFNVEGTQCFDVFVCDTGSLTINSATVNGGTKSGSTAVWAKNTGKVTINGGTFTIRAVEGDYNDLIYAKDSAEITVTGGHFSGVYSQQLGSSYLLNIKNGSNAKITVTGGTYVNFNPANSNTEPGGDNNFCDEGYCAKVENDIYTVSAHAYQSQYIEPTFDADGYIKYTCVCGDSYVEPDEGSMRIAVAKIGDKRYESLADAIAAAKNGDTIVLIGKYIVTGTETWELDGITLEISAIDGNYGVVVKGDLTINGGTFVVNGTYGIGVTGTLTVNGGTFKVAGDNDYLIGNWGSTTITGGEFIGQYSCVNNFAGTTEIKGGTFTTAATDSTGEYDSSDVMADTGLTITGGTFSKNVNDYCADGYGLYMVDEAYVVHRHTEVIDGYVAPTCTTTGLTEGKHCSVCNEVLVAQTVVDALGHTEVIDKAVEATCSATGLTEGSHCSVCNEVLVKQETVEKAEHTEVIIPGVAFTCTTPGSTEGVKCSVCEAVLVPVNTVPAQHIEDEDQAVEPTCSSTGLTAGKHCSVCNEVLVAQETVDALGHTYNDGVVTKKPTCTEPGVKTFTCENDASHTYTEPVKETGHNYVEGECTVCGEADPDAVAFVPKFGTTVETNEGDNNTLVTTFKAGTNISVAPTVTITSPVNGWKRGEENVFTVASEGNVACVVIVKNGDTYTRLTATTTGDVHSFTHTFTDDCEIIVAVKGDANGDGSVGVSDRMMIAASLGNASFNSLQKLIADVNNDGNVGVADRMMVAACLGGNATIQW